MTRLHVCWTFPSTQPPAEDAVLSFLPPADEERLARGFSGALLRARELSLPVRARARQLYLDLSAELAASRGASGRTLREEAASGPGASPWWWHPSSFKDCESDPAFGLIIAALTILEARRRLRATSLRLVGAPDELLAALRPLPGVETPAPRSAWRPAWVWMRGLAARTASALRHLRERSAAAAVKAGQVPRGAVLFSGFWDWSVSATADGLLADRYTKALPSELEKLGLPVAWLCWFDPEGEPSLPRRDWRGVTSALDGRADAILLQPYLAVTEILAAHTDFRPLRAYLNRRAEPDFPALFLRDGLDLLPLFEERLLRGFLDGCLPRCALVALAAERAARELQPTATVSFLEHNPYARAFNDGVRRGEPRAVLTAFQHASLCREKTFYFLDPAREFRGEPDGRPAPSPDLVFAMGAQSREHLLSCGYPPERVLLTGNPRYDSLRPGTQAPPPGSGVRLLIAAGLDTSVEIDMVEAAVAAADGLPEVAVVVRDHPFSRVSEHPRFAALAGRVSVSTATLQEDLARASVVLFTYSTVAEEAALQGKTVWQWRPLSYDASALAEVADIPRFASVPALRAALSAFHPAPLAATERTRVTELLFHRLDGGAAARVAAALKAAIQGKIV